MAVDEVTAELYGLPLDAFTSTRNSKARELKAAGDEEAASRVAALKKPTTAAWLVNQLVRREREQVDLLLDLGRELRAGMAGLSADELRTLTKRRYQLVSLLVNTALSYAGPRRPGADVASDVQTTLEATLADPDSADAVAAGSLTQPLHVSGFGFAGRPDVIPADDTTTGPDADVLDMAAHRERRAKLLDEARERVVQARAEALLDAVRDAGSPSFDLIADVAEPGWRGSAVGVYRLWRDLGFAVGAILAGIITDAVGIGAAIWAVAVLTAGSGLIVFQRMQETRPILDARPENELTN